MSPQTLSEYIEGLPNISGSEDLVAQAMARSGPFYLPQSGIDFGGSVLGGAHRSPADRAATAAATAMTAITTRAAIAIEPSASALKKGRAIFN